MQFPEGWREVEVEEALGVANALRDELNEKHILHGRGFILIARRDDQDDVLLELDDGKIAELHMTWVKQTDGKFPGALIYDDIDEWLKVQV